MTASDDVITKAMAEILDAAEGAKVDIAAVEARAKVMLDALKGQESEPMALATVAGCLTSSGWFYTPTEKPRVNQPVGYYRRIVLGGLLTNDVPDGDYDFVVLVYPRAAADGTRRKKPK